MIVNSGILFAKIRLTIFLEDSNVLTFLRIILVSEILKMLIKLPLVLDDWFKILFLALRIIFLGIILPRTFRR